MTDMKALRRQLLAGGMGLLIGLTTAACSSHTETTPGTIGTPIPVKVAKVTMTALAETFEAGGVVQARTTAVVTARILAPVLAVRVAPGDRVRAGQVLVVLDGRELGGKSVV